MKLNGVLTGQLMAREAAPILAAAGVTRETMLGPDGMEFEYGGRRYWILEYETTFPGPTAYSPDGRHTVYAPSGADLPPEEKSSWDFEGLLKAGAVALGLVLAIQIVGAVKKM